ncbi:MAG TPA: MOSC domain-containing protein [Candidatus Limnocylindrales bacterium]|nr:MOSC domain-containing protein [Candidatus Limnocylindrales bacterium]
MATATSSILDAHLDSVRAAPADRGRVELLVRRPAVDEREVLVEAVVDPGLGLVGDTWLARGNAAKPDGADPAVQLTLINVRVLAAIEPDRSRWPLAGDQVYVDFDLSVAGLPAGSRLEIGSALIEVSPQPHTGCAKFSARFGSEALRWINSPAGRACRMRGLNARVIRGGTIRPGDEIRRHPHE